MAMRAEMSRSTVGALSPTVSGSCGKGLKTVCLGPHHKPSECGRVGSNLVTFPNAVAGRG